MPLVINSPRGGHTHIHADIRTEIMLRNQVCGGLWPVHAWLNKQEPQNIAPNINHTS